MIAFGALRPDLITRKVTISGLAAGESVQGIDFGPVDGRLYALGSSSRIYTLDTLTGAATAVATAAFTPALAGSSFGFDFNPVPNRVRVHGNTTQNLRLVPRLGGATDGTVAAVDGNLSYALTDAGAGQTPAIGGTAYTNSVAGATTTVLYAIDFNRDVLTTLANPNDGVMTTVGAICVSYVGVLPSSCSRKALSRSLVRYGFCKSRFTPWRESCSTSASLVMPLMATTRTVGFMPRSSLTNAAPLMTGIMRSVSTIAISA